MELPPLRSRTVDIPLLVQHFLAQLGREPSTVSYEQLLRWERLDWPGNVRELRNAVARVAALGELGDVERSPAPKGLTSAFHPFLQLPIGLARQRLVDAFDRVYLEHVLERHGGDIEKSAAASGLARRQFFRLKAKSTT